MSYLVLSRRLRDPPYEAQCHPPGRPPVAVPLDPIGRPFAQPPSPLVGCGHDDLTAAFLTAAELAARAVRDQVDDLIVLVCPAEAANAISLA